MAYAHILQSEKTSSNLLRNNGKLLFYTIMQISTLNFSLPF